MERAALLLVPSFVPVTATVGVDPYEAHGCEGIFVLQCGQSEGLHESRRIVLFDPEAGVSHVMA